MIRVVDKISFSVATIGAKPRAPLIKTLAQLQTLRLFQDTIEMVGQYLLQDWRVMEMRQAFLSVLLTLIRLIVAIQTMLEFSAMVR